MSKIKKSEWFVPAGLIFLSLVPIVSGALRLSELAGGPAFLPAAARFVASPMPVVLHIVSVTIFCLLGAFQFVPGIRAQRPQWHRMSGRLLVPSGLITAVSGLWMSQFYDLPATDGALLYAFRLIFGFGMIASILLGLRAILRRDIARHRAWMMRGYAIALGTGVQVLTVIPWQLIVGTPGVLARAWLFAAGWIISLAVAEWIIRRRSPRTNKPARMFGYIAGSGQR